MLSEQLYQDLHETLTRIGRADLAARLKAEMYPDLTLNQTTERLGFTDPKVVRNWLQGGAFPGAYQTLGGHWLFPQEDVQRVLAHIEEIKQTGKF